MITTHSAYEYGQIKLDISRLRDIRSGEELYGVYGSDGGFIGTAFADFESGELRIGKNLG